MADSNPTLTASKRYVRQRALVRVGTDGQERLRHARVLCIGAGGLGSPAALYLAAAGVGHLTLIDPDQVDLSNLQRQILYHTHHVGGPKALHAAQQLQALNPEVGVTALQERFDATNADDLAAHCDLILEGSDNFSTKFLANDAAYKHKKPLVYAAVDQLEGHVALFRSWEGACYRCLHREAPRSPVQNCVEAGVLGSVVGTLGTLQATLALQYLIAGENPTHPLYPVSGQLSTWCFDGPWEMGAFMIKKRPDCPTCSLPPEDIAYAPGETTNASCGRGTQPERAWLPGEALELRLFLKEHHATLLDVRSEEEWNGGHLPGALHWPLARLERHELPHASDTSRPWVLYCHSGVRSKQGCVLLASRGWTNVSHLQGGWLSWHSLPLA